MVVDKAAGMVVHPGAGHRAGTLVNALLHHVKDLAGVGGTLRPGIVHRLDKDTTGLLVVAKNEPRAAGAPGRLQGARGGEDLPRAGAGAPAAEPAPSAPSTAAHPDTGVRFSGKVKRGKAAVTHYRVTRQLRRRRWWRCAWRPAAPTRSACTSPRPGFPLLSDALYGSRKARRPEVIGRQALHAARLRFPPPAHRRQGDLRGAARRRTSRGRSRHSRRSSRHINMPMDTDCCRLVSTLTG